MRVGNFEAVKPDRNKPFESYDLSKDIGEKKDIASEYPNTLAKMKAYAGQSHTENLIRDVLYKEKIFKGHELR